MNKKHIPDCKLEWYLLGTLPKQEQAEIAALEQADVELRARIEALRASDTEILEDYPPPRIAERLAQLRQRYPGTRGTARTRKRQWSASVLICLALLLILPMLIIVVPALIDTMESDSIHAKDESVIDMMETGGSQAEDESVTETIEADGINAKDGEAQ